MKIDKKIIFNYKYYTELLINQIIRFLLLHFYIIFIFIIMAILIFILFCYKPCEVFKDILVSVLAGLLTGLFLYYLGNKRLYIIDKTVNSADTIYKLDRSFSKIYKLLIDLDKYKSKISNKTIKDIKINAKKLNDNFKIVRMRFSDKYYNDFIKDFDKFDIDYKKIKSFKDLKMFYNKYIEPIKKLYIKFSEIANNLSLEAFYRKTSAL